MLIRLGEILPLQPNKKSEQVKYEKNIDVNCMWLRWIGYYAFNAHRFRCRGDGGIATYTSEIIKLLKGSKTKLLDTRKTTPNMRIFEKSAVKVGGGCNHRYNLSDGILLKDNHIGAAGSVKNAVKMAKEYAPFVRKIEVETENLDMVKDALEAGADIIMLDNMSVEEMIKAVELCKGKAETECSGNVSKENVEKYVNIGVDYISSGALTHSAPILDLSLKNLHKV